MRIAFALVVCLLAACGGDDDAPAAADAAAGGDGVVLSYRGSTAQMALGYLGFQRSGDTITELYFELSNMAEPGCPSDTSPIPPQLFTISGFTGAEPATRTFADGVRVNFFDFEGTLREEIEPAAATAASLTVTSLDVEAGTATVDLDLTFGEDGTAVGSFSATHCDSLDASD